MGIEIVVTVLDNGHSKGSKLENETWVTLPNYDKAV